MPYSELENKLRACAESYPPDFEGMKRLLAEGADINACDEHLEETLLTEIIMGYPECKDINPCMTCSQAEDCDTCDQKRDNYDSSYLPTIVRFFLENGYDVNKLDGFFGAAALRALSWSSYDKCILEGAKLLLDAGANPLFQEEDMTVLEWIGIKCSAGIAVDDSLEQECLFSLLYDIMEAKTKDEPYAEIHWPDIVIGKNIDRVYSVSAIPEEAVFDFSTGQSSYRNCFRENIILECEGIPLSLTHYCHAYVNPYLIPEDEKCVDLSDILGDLLGKRIKGFGFGVTKAEQNRMIHSGSALRILFDDDSCLQVMDNGDKFGEEYCTMFAILGKWA